MMNSQITRVLFITIITLLLLISIITINVRNERHMHMLQRKLLQISPLHEEEHSVTLNKTHKNDNSNNTALLTELRQRMKPSDLICSTESCPEKQFFHLHHMKSGGTSVDSWIYCVRKRFQQARQGLVIPSSSLSECSVTYFKDCLKDENHACRSRIASSAMMSYCAPLFTPNMLGWDKARAITMLRHPVDRVWSMYRYTTLYCYQCKTLKQVYQFIDLGQTETMPGVCAPQITNHMTRNLLSNQDPTLDLQGQLENAMYNLKHRFTVVMVLERLQESIDLVQYSFPWMKTTIEGSSQVCEFPHANASPQNNRCGPNNTHLPLPSHPDEETRALIIQHNQLDLQLYEAALQYFELQLQAVGDVDESVE